MSRTKCSYPAPSAFPEHSDSPTLSLWHVRVPEWPSSWWHVGFAVALEPRCSNQTCKAACGKPRVMFKTEKLQKVKLWVLALWQDDRLVLPSKTPCAVSNGLIRRFGWGLPDFGCRGVGCRWQIRFVSWLFYLGARWAGLITPLRKRH